MTEIFIAAFSGAFMGCVMVGIAVMAVTESHRRTTMEKQRLMYEEALRESERMTAQYRETVNLAAQRLAETQKEAARRIDTALDRASRTLPDTGEVN